MAGSSSGVLLRPVASADLPILFAQQQEPGASHMAGFVSRDPRDRAAFDAHWARILSDDTVTMRAVVHDGRVVGHIGSFVLDGKPQVTYWIGRAHWGKGLATEALARFLEDVKQRPLHASAAADNLASIRVLEKCGFVATGRERAYAAARGEEIEEVFLRLD